MIELTATHQSIIKRQGEGWTDQKIQRVLGLKPSDFLAALQHIRAWKEQQKKLEPVAFPVVGDDQIHDAAAYRVLVQSKEPMTPTDLGAQIGLGSHDAGMILRRLERRKLALAPMRGFWRAK